MSSVLKRLFEAFTRRDETRSGYAYPRGSVIWETQEITLPEIMELYAKDPACKASVDLLAAATVGMGFYTTANEEYERAAEAKEAVDNFNGEVNLDGLLCDMARVLIACGNDFWLKITPDKLENLQRLPIGAIEKIQRNYFEGLKIPGDVTGYKLHHDYGGETLKPEAVIHWRINCLGSSAYGTGILQVLLETLKVKGDTRPSYAWMKAKIEKIMPKIFEKYAGPDVLVILENVKEETIQKFQQAIKTRPEEGTWLFYGGKGAKGEIHPIQLDPRSRFEYYIDHIINQFYLGCETPLPRLFSTPGFTEASANAALDLQNMLIKPIQRYIKRQVERDIFTPVLQQAGHDQAEVQIRLNFGAPEVPEIAMVDLIKAAEIGLIRPEEFRKNAVKWGWQLWEPQEPETFQEAQP